MNKRISLLVFTLALPLLMVALLAHVSHLSSQEPNSHHKLEPALVERLNEQPYGSLHFIVHVANQANLAHDLPQNRLERRAAVVRRLQQTASSSQQALLSALNVHQSSGHVSSVRPLWIINAILVEGRPQVVYELAQRQDVSRITLDARQQFIRPPDLQPQETPALNWNLKQIRAPHVWNGLGVTGLGVTVAIMDTGVDWTHPDLRDNYRGWQSVGSVQHEGHWYDAVDGASSGEPFDPNGHGTHVAGSAVGRGGTGVAPDAKWIAVRVFDSGGYGTTGDLHLAFQWLLAPGGRPELAPDVINGSWSGSGQNTAFIGDLQALHQAGIVTVFAAGNEGPNPGTIGAPASYSGAIAVAAVDYREEVAWFSARGPSPLTGDPKPELAAPGARIYSTLPNASYGIYNGTSMAAPHVSGAAALLLSVNPALDVSKLTRVLTETARNTPTTGPDTHRGWGQLDAYAAVASQMPVGRIQGAVISDNSPVPGAAVTVTTPTGVSLHLRTDSSGQYTAWLRAGLYRLEASAYGYFDAAPLTVNVLAGGAAHQNLSLTPLPRAVITGQVMAASSGEPLSGAQITVSQTPVSTTTDARGIYTLTLPSGYSHTLRAQHLGFRLSTYSTTLESGVPVAHDFVLESTQSILLVDSGRWYYDSHATYYRQALNAAGYAFDEWNIYAPGDTPPAETLSQYDVVIWTAPQDSPGWIGGGEALSTYLQSGGNLLISGQHVARRDGASPTAQSWFTQYLEGRYLGAATAPFTLTGHSGTPYAGIQFALNADDSAANQTNPSRVGARPGALTRPLLAYIGDSEGASGALQAGWCQPHRVLFLGFGLEGAGPSTARTALMQRALDHFAAPPVARALALDPVQTNEVIFPGETLTVTFNLQNLSEVQTTTIDLEFQSQWQAELSESTVKLGPCQQRPLTLTLQAPAEMTPGARQAIELTAIADYGAVAGASVVASSPAPVLLVADYRWYDETSAYRSALHDLQLTYDIWDTNQRGSPGFERLAAYQTVLWFTGYDWYEPLTSGEIHILQQYLENGGRLFFSSQDYLYYHRHRAFTRDFLGVLDYQETITSTAILGGDNSLAGDGLGPFTLDYDPYRNFSDGLVPTADAQIHLWDDWGFASGLARSDDSWRSVFWSVPFELLPSHARTFFLGNILGWLGDVGDSTLEVTPRIAPASETRHYTLTVRNWQSAPTHQLAMTTTIGSDLILDPSSITGGASYDSHNRQLLWHGTMDPGAEHIIAFNALPDGSAQAGSRLNITSTVAYEGHSPPWQRAAPIWIDTAELATSYLQVNSTAVRPGQLLTYTAHLRNSAATPAKTLSATLSLPHGLTPITDTLWAPAGSVTFLDRNIRWRGALDAGAEISFTVTVSASGILQQRTLPAGLVVMDGVSSPVIRGSTLEIDPYRALLPLISR